MRRSIDARSSDEGRISWRFVIPSQDIGRQNRLHVATMPPHNKSKLEV
jgi:hypothetical protein